MIIPYVQQPGLFHSLSSIPDLERTIRRKGKITLMMGQTFDGGQPVDMMKYALTLMQLSDMLGDTGANPRAEWLLADHFMVAINKDTSTAEAAVHLQNREAYLELLNRAYGGNIHVRRSSHVSQEESYQRELNRLLAAVDSQPSFRSLVLQTIPADRRGNPDAVRYPLEELATIATLETDIKMGPPYEALYDTAARALQEAGGFRPYVGLYLTPSLPLGALPAGVQESADIATFGVLPYKINSKGLRAHRIDPLTDSLTAVEQLVEQTTDSRAVLDLLVIGELARQRLLGERGVTFGGAVGEALCMPEVPFRYDEPALATGERLDLLKDLALGLYTEYIHQPLRGTS